LRHPNDEAIAMGYIGIFLRPGHSRELSVDAPTVQPHTAVELTFENAPAIVYVIEPDAKLRPSPRYIAPDHRIAEALRGKRAGEAITLPDGKTGTIAWIKPKVLHALHDLLDDFKNRFPDATGIEKVQIDVGKDDAFKDVFDRVRQRHEAAEHIASLYDTGALPIALVARSLGCDTIEALAGLGSTGHTIHVCDGSSVERDTATNAIAANGRRGCVVDAVTLHVIQRLHIEDAVIKICGPIHIVDSTSLRLQRKIHEMGDDLDKEGMTLLWQDGQPARQIISPEEKREALRRLEEEQAWIAAHATIIPAEGKTDPDPNWTPITERFGRSFLDEIRAAQGAGLLFLTEDKLLRTLAWVESGVPGTWLQPILMEAVRIGHLSVRDYAKAVIAFIDSRFHFISISSDLLIHAMEEAPPHGLSKEFKSLAAALGGKGVELQSHLSVSYNAARALAKNEALSWTSRDAVIGHMLERLTDGRSLAEIYMVISLWQEQSRRDSWRIGEYVHDWMRGHFIPPPSTPAPSAR
jgi:TPR-GreAB-C-PIN type conflict system protein